LRAELRFRLLQQVRRVHHHQVNLFAAIEHEANDRGWGIADLQALAA
jgi:hypothetical protein